MKPNRYLEQDICIHIFTVSAAMVGVCLTVIGLIRVVITVGTINTLADDLLATDAFLFLVACLLSYSSLRTRNKNRMHRVERIADGIFIVAMILMTAICGVITYAMSAGRSSLRTTGLWRRDCAKHTTSAKNIATSPTSLIEVWIDETERRTWFLFEAT